MVEQGIQRISIAEPEQGSCLAGVGSMAMRSSLLTRFLRDPEFRVRTARLLLGRPMPLETPDRTVLETVIFPYFQYLPGICSVLFVGCDWYTKHYERAYFEGKDYWTIDPAPRARRFAGSRHIVAPLEELGRHFQPERFDLIVCNGVFGYGLNGQRQCDEAFLECHARLRQGGYLIVGWDDVPERTPVSMEDIMSLKAFQRMEFPPFGRWRYRTDTTYLHTYDFYRKAARGS
jgi:SAM-dependent methyltransferase